MKLAIVGSRDYFDYDVFKETLDHYLKKKQITPTRIISGGAPGVDSLARRWAKENDIVMTEHFADWHTHGPAAGPIRNALIIKDAEGVIAFWDKKSPGTKDSIEKAKQKSILLNVFIID